MNEERARRNLDDRVASGGKLVVAYESDWSVVKRLLARCHEAGVPAVLGACPKGG